MINTMRHTSEIASVWFFLEEFMISLVMGIILLARAQNYNPDNLSKRDSTYASDDMILKKCLMVAT